MQKEVEFNEEKYIVKSPEASVLKEARIYSAAFLGQLLDRGVKTQRAIDDVVNNELPEWVKDKQKKVAEILDKLKKGGYPKLEARQDAIECFELRIELLTYMSNLKTELSADSLADEAEDEFIISSCLLHSNGRRVYANPEAYANATDTDLCEFLVKEFRSLSESENFVDTLEEVKFLKKYGYMNDDNQLINEQGEAVDKDFNVVNKEEEFVEFT